MLQRITALEDPRLPRVLRLRAALGGAITPAAVRDAPPGCVEDAVATCNLRNAKVSQRVHRRFHRLYLAF